MQEEEYNQIFEQSQIASAVGQQAQQQAASQYFLEDKERNLAETQIEVETVLEKIYHLLKQDIYFIENGKEDWKELSDPKQRALTDWGVDRLMQTINFYINKNVLLSNFSEDQINRLMLRFCNELNDLVLLKYEKLFRQPSFEECKEILLARIDEQKKLKMFASEIVGIKLNEAEVKKTLLEETEARIEYEMKKIKQEQIKEKLKEYGLLMAQMETMVYASYNRAWKGEERGSIRRHTNISEVIGGNRATPNKESGGMFKWIKN